MIIPLIKRTAVLRFSTSQFFHEYILVISRRMIDSMFVFYPITLAPNGIKESLAILKNCLPNGIPTIVIHHMHPAKTQAKPPSNPPNINQRILPIVLMTTHPYPMFNILLQFPLLSYISLGIFLSPPAI